MIEIRWSRIAAYIIAGIALYLLLSNLDAIERVFCGIERLVPPVRHNDPLRGVLSLAVIAALVVAAIKLITRKG